MCTRAIALLLPAAAALAGGAAAQTQIYAFTGQDAGDRLGHSVSGVGDLDGDGLADFLGSAPGDGTAGLSAGQVLALSGGTGTMLFGLQGEAAFDSLGRRVDAVGDADGDGTPDFLATRVPGLRVYSGTDGAVLFDVPFPGVTAARGAGDVDADGFTDVVLGSFSQPVELRSGVTGGLLATLPPMGFLDGDVAGIGDVDGDGFGDVAVGDRAFQTKSGRVVVYSGQTQAMLYQVVGPAINQQLGWTVQDAGDVDADGVPDFAAGAPLSNESCQGGNARVYSGAGGALLHDLAIGCFDLFGAAVDGAGDVDGDGHADLVTGRSFGGSAQLWSGATGAMLFEVVNGPSADCFGEAVAGPGDVNGDGVPDFVTGGPCNDLGGADAGRLWVHSGAPLALSSNRHLLSLGAGGPRPSPSRAGPRWPGSPTSSWARSAARPRGSRCRRCSCPSPSTPTPRSPCRTRGRRRCPDPWARWAPRAEPRRASRCRRGRRRACWGSARTTPSRCSIRCRERGSWRATRCR